MFFSKKDFQFNVNKHIALISVLSLFAGFLFAQEQKKTLVYLEQSDIIQFDQKRLPDVQIIKGNVRFRHENALMYCDSAYFYTKESSFDAFGNVRIVEGDSIFIYGDYLFYNGNIKLARLRRNVRLENSTAVLTTDSMNYNRNTDLAYYYTGGKLKDSENTLTSIWGQYSPNTKQALFSKNVRLVNESYTMDSDTLKYNTESKIADIVGQTHIIYKDETNIYSKKGWYNTESGQSMLLDRSLIVHKDGKTVTGDTLFYDKTKKIVEGFKRVEMNDTVQKATLSGNYVFYDEGNEKGYLTDSALVIDWSTSDSLFLHADALHLSKDSTYDVVRGFFNVRFYKSDFQGACDSLVYLSKDSIATMYGEPVVWSGENQLSGETIVTYIKNSAVDHVHIPRGALAIQKVDSLYYNQLSGKELTANLDSGNLKHILVSGNAETIYCPVDEKDTTIVGVNKTQSSYVNMYFKERKIDRIILTATSTGTMYPLGELQGDNLYLNKFFWIDEQRPKQKKDVFLIFPRNRQKSSISHSQSASGGGDSKSSSSATTTKVNTTNKKPR